MLAKYLQTQTGVPINIIQLAQTVKKSAVVEVDKLTVSLPFLSPRNYYRLPSSMVNITATPLSAKTRRAPLNTYRHIILQQSQKDECLCNTSFARMLL